MVARLEARLKDKPDDLEGWLMLARSKAALDDAPAAVAAYRKAAALAPDDPRAVAGLAETLTIAQGGVVPPEARALFEKLQAKGTGEDPRPGYYLGLAAAQAGDGTKALDLWRALLARTPADAPWRPRIEEAIRTAAGDFGLDAGPVLAQAGPPVAPAPDKPAAGGGDSMTPEQRSEFIRGMVGKLEAKLDADGSDPVGWLRLGQARLVLGEPDKARAAYERGLALHPDDSGLLKAEAALLLGPPPSADTLPRVGDDAAKLYARAAAAAPGDPEPQWFLGVRAPRPPPPTPRRGWATTPRSPPPAPPPPPRTTRSRSGSSASARSRRGGRTRSASAGAGSSPASGPTSPTTPWSSSASTASAAE